MTTWEESCSKSALPKADRTLPSWWPTSSPSTLGTLLGTAFSVEIIEASDGYVQARIHGERAAALFANEPGGHRWQRIPPTERRGRVQSSSVTVAVLPEPDAQAFRLDERDLQWRTCRGSGAGGQKRNKTESAVEVTHRPSGLVVRVETERSQHQNKEAALGLLRARLAHRQRDLEHGNRNADRRVQVGAGQRGDKVRTYRVRDNIVIDHRTGRKAPLARVLKGDLDWLRDRSGPSN